MWSKDNHQGQKRRLSALDEQLWNGTLELPYPANNKKHDERAEIPEHWTLLHIPKTAGDSLMLDAPKHLPIGTTLTGNCESSLARTKKDAPIVVLLREPTSHVLSQFLECKYDWWGKAQTNGTSFPGMGKLDDVMGGFDAWIKHFVDIARHRKYGPSVAFNCYDPYNMQARYLAAGVSLSGAHLTRQRKDRFPSVTAAKKKLMQQVQVVGIVKHYPASICLLEYHAMGGQLVTPECQVCDETTQKISLATSDALFHEAHDVPPHSISMISNATRAIIEGEMTRVDKELYRAGLKLFQQEVDAVYEATGVDLLCRPPQQMLKGAAKSGKRNSSEKRLILPPTRTSRQLGVIYQLALITGLLGLVTWVFVFAPRQRRRNRRHVGRR